jgi:hypothetical protein
VVKTWPPRTVLGHYRKLKNRVRSDRRPSLIFVLGSQRSGTNVLRRSLSLDPHVQGFNERKNDDFYSGWALRPEPEIRPLLESYQHTVLLKPIQSVIRRPVAEFLDEFRDYEFRVVWIYRDPLAVFRSRGKRWSYKANAAPFIREWNRVNSSALDAQDERMAVVCYDQLAEDESAFRALCNWLGVRGEYLFHPTRPHESVASGLSADEVAEIRTHTTETLERLHAAAARFLDDDAVYGRFPATRSANIPQTTGRSNAART